ncbi:branched-chain amino acid ABC transporter permease [Nonomuraea sp. NPDC049486]|uniref:branched-chain amino acid ABC transporter permease n=1 Tax=Nonomuraea sp. NPDC049486 TaxID=3155773 RepID=UPI003437D325
MELLLQLLVNGIAVGAVYGLFAVAFGTTYLVAKVFHVALAAVFATAAFAYQTALAAGLPAAAAVFAAAAAALVTGLFCEGVVYRTLRRRGGDEMMLLVGSLAVMAIVSSTIALVWGHTPLPVPGFGDGTSYTFGGVHITLRQIIIVACGVLATVGVAAFMNGTAEGRKMRAVSDNPVLAGAAGISVQRSYLWAFAIGSLVATVAAILFSSGRTITPFLGLQPTLVGAVAVIFGGTGRPVPNFLVGIFLGIVQSVALWRVESIWETAILFGILFLVLLLRPHGLFGNARTAMET